MLRQTYTYVASTMQYPAAVFVFTAMHILPKHSCMSIVLLHSLQAIRVQTAPGSIHSGVLHIIKEQNQVNTEDMRVCAMHHWNPVHTFMFNSRGKLLNANRAAKGACQNSSAGGSYLPCIYLPKVAPPIPLSPPRPPPPPPPHFATPGWVC